MSDLEMPTWERIWRRLLAEGVNFDRPTQGMQILQSVLTPIDRYQRVLWDEAQRLRDEVSAIRVRPIPHDDDPGYQLWRALMEDARDHGEVRLAVRHVEHVEVSWEPRATED